MHKKLVFLLIIVVALASCDLMDNDKELTIPVLGFSGLSRSRVITNEDMDPFDVMATLFSPALTGFEKTTAKDGDSFVQTYMGSSITLGVSSFSNGTNGISKGTRFSGDLDDGSGTIVVEVSEAQDRFYYEQAIYVNDNLGRTGSASHALVHTSLLGRLEDDGTVIAHGSFVLFLDPVSSEESKKIQASSNYEVYLGPYDGSTGQGVGILVQQLKVVEENNLPATVPTLDSMSNRDTVATYAKSFLSTTNFIEAPAVSGLPLVTRLGAGVSGSFMTPVDAEAAYNYLAANISRWAELTDLTF